MLEDDDSWSALPQNENNLPNMVLLNLRIGNVSDVDKWLPATRVHHHVVLPPAVKIAQSELLRVEADLVQRFSLEFSANIFIEL